MLTIDAILRSVGIDPADAQAIRHVLVREHEDTGLPGTHADSTDDEITSYSVYMAVPLGHPLIGRWLS